MDNEYITDYISIFIGQSIFRKRIYNKSNYIQQLFYNYYLIMLKGQLERDKSSQCNQRMKMMGTILMNSKKCFVTI